MSDISSGAYNIHDLRELARRRLPKGLFEFVDRGAEDEITLRSNREALERIRAWVGCRGIAELSPEYLDLPRTAREQNAAGPLVS